MDGLGWVEDGQLCVAAERGTEGKEYDNCFGVAYKATYLHEDSPENNDSIKELG